MPYPASPEEYRGIRMPRHALHEGTENDFPGLMKPIQTLKMPDQDLYETYPGIEDAPPGFIFFSF